MSIFYIKYDELNTLFSPSGIVVCNFVLFLTTLMTIWCFYDVAGKHWVKLKKYQQSLKDREQVVIAQTVRHQTKTFRDIFLDSASDPFGYYRITAEQP